MLGFLCHATECQGPSAGHPQPHLTSALCWLCLPQKSQGSSLGELRTHENSPKPSAGCRPCQGEQRGLRRLSADSPQSFASPQLDSCCQPGKSSGESPGGTSQATEDAWGHQLALQAARISASTNAVPAGCRTEGQESPGLGAETSEKPEVGVKNLALALGGPRGKEPSRKRIGNVGATHKATHHPSQTQPQVTDTYF